MDFEAGFVALMLEEDLAAVLAAAAPVTVPAACSIAETAIEVGEGVVILI